MCNTCCNTCNAYNTANACGGGLFNTLFGNSCQCCNCGNNCGCNAARVARNAAANACRCAAVAAQAAAQANSGCCGCGCGCDHDHDHGDDHIKPPLLVNRFLRFLRSRAVCRDLWRRLRARLCLRAAGRAEIALKFCTAMTAFHVPVLLSVYLSVRAAWCRRPVLPNKRWKTGRFSLPCARRIWLFPVNFGKSRKLPNR